MIAFIKYEVCEDYWCFKPSNEIDLAILKRLDYYPWFRKSDTILEIRIESLENSNDPFVEQIETLNFIVENQIEIINSIYDYYQKVILPVYQVATDIEEDEKVVNISELNKVFGTKGIEIPLSSHSGTKYYLIEFDFKYDDEHGLYILFRDTTAIDFFAEGDKNFNAIEFYQENITNRDEEPIYFKLYHLNGEMVFEEKYHYDERINFSLKRGTYRTFITFNQSEKCRNIFVANDLETFTIRQLLTED